MQLRLLILILVIFSSANTKAQNINVYESGGWFESAYIKWQPLNNVESYNVYYSGEGIINKKIDNELIRDYGTYYRADILGLKAGNYTLTIVPVKAGVEGEGTVSDMITVISHDRTGFAFNNGRLPGAYKADGTPKDNAVILYITENTKNTISLNVNGATNNPCIGLQTILDGFKKGKDSRPLIIRLIGQITDLAYMLNGDIVVENSRYASSYITIEGVGDDAVAYGWGIRIKNAANIEIRNLGFMNCNSDELDNIGLQQDNEFIWVHNCDFFYGAAGSAADQAKGDGALDCKKSTYVTFSYNHFWDSGKSNLLGLSEGTTSGLYITFHHNWYDHSDSRHPRVRYYSAHVYNNYYDGNSKYGIGATMGSSVYAEANYFRNCKYPMLISMQGSDVFNETTQTNDYVNMPTFSKEDGGIIKAFNNYMTGHKRFVAYGNSNYPNSTIDFDAYVVTNRNEKINTDVITYKGAKTYNNFDTDLSVMYSYTADSPEEAKEKVMNYAGRVKGGDFKWTFNNSVDDASYEVNSALKTAIVNYKTKLVSVQGESSANNGNEPDTSENKPIIDTGSVIIHNFTLSGKTSSFFTINGNLSDSKGTVYYEGLTLTQCLKMESTTSISFSINKEAELTLVFNSDFSGNIKINDTSYYAMAGKLKQLIGAGKYTITKYDAANLYYIILKFKPIIEDTTDTDDTTAIIDSTANTDTTNSINFSNNSLYLINIYPNPVKDYFIIDTEDRIEKVEIYSITGLLILKNSEYYKVIDTRNLSDGTYVVIVYTDKGLLRQKIIKK
jgi:pectate lyase